VKVPSFTRLNPHNFSNKFFHRQLHAFGGRIGDTRKRMDFYCAAWIWHDGRASKRNLSHGIRKQLKAYKIKIHLIQVTTQKINLRVVDSSRASATIRNHALQQ
jgi:hypothetical protein